MAKLKKFFRFLGVWVLSVVLVALVASAVFPVGDDGQAVNSELYSLVIVVVPIVSGAFSVYLLPKIKTRSPRSGPLVCPPGSLPEFVSNAQTDSMRDELFPDAVAAVIESQQASISMLQRRFNLGYARAARLIDEMERLGLVGPFCGSAPRQILISEDSWEKIALKRVGQNRAPTSSVAVRIKPFDVVDVMDGHEFEHWCADVLRKIGFSNVRVTQGSGDQGVDILAEKDGIKYAIQCKCYSSDLGNKPVQEVNAGRTIYHCHIGVVMTNRYFTAGAKQAAEATGVILWNRDDVKKMAMDAGMLMSTY